MTAPAQPTETTTDVAALARELTDEQWGAVLWWGRQPAIPDSNAGRKARALLAHLDEIVYSLVDEQRQRLDDLDGGPVSDDDEDRIDHWEPVDTTLDRLIETSEDDYSWLTPYGRAVLRRAEGSADMTDPVCTTCGWQGKPRAGLLSGLPMCRGCRGDMRDPLPGRVADRIAARALREAAAALEEHQPWDGWWEAATFLHARANELDPEGER